LEKLLVKKFCCEAHSEIVKDFHEDIVIVRELRPVVKLYENCSCPNGCPTVNEIGETSGIQDLTKLKLYLEELRNKGFIIEPKTGHFKPLLEM